MEGQINISLTPAHGDRVYDTDGRLFHTAVAAKTLIIVFAFQKMRRFLHGFHIQFLIQWRIILTVKDRFDRTIKTGVLVSLSHCLIPGMEGGQPPPALPIWQ